MIYTKPDYYDQFRCVADQCEDTCCAGWQIVIDKESMEKYRKFHTEYAFKVMAAVDWEEEVFRQDKEGRCAFLNQNNLCDLYTNAGEESLCKTCKNYPRHIEEFEGVREITLSLSCPEVARILMEKNEPVRFVTEETEEAEKEDFSDFDPFLFSVLEDAREAMITIAQNREIPLSERMLLVLGMAHDMQGRINRQEMFDCYSVIEKYKTKKAEAFIKDYIKKESEDTLEEKRKHCLKIAYQMELLKEDWDVVLKETEDTLFYHPQKDYQTIRKEFLDWKWNKPSIDIHLEQIFVYFLFTYFPGAVYDGLVYAKIQLAVFATWMMENIWMARFVLNENQLEKDEMTGLLYRFSREIEHSDKNLTKLDKIMASNWILK